MYLVVCLTGARLSSSGYATGGELSEQIFSHLHTRPPVTSLQAAFLQKNMLKAKEGRKTK